VRDRATLTNGRPQDEVGVTGLGAGGQAGLGIGIGREQLTSYGGWSWCALFPEHLVWNRPAYAQGSVSTTRRDYGCVHLVVLGSRAFWWLARAAKQLRYVAHDPLFAGCVVWRAFRRTDGSEVAEGIHPSLRLWHWSDQ